MSHVTHPCFRDAAASLSQAGYAYDHELECWTRADGARARIERTTRLEADRAHAYVVLELEPQQFAAATHNA